MRGCEYTLYVPAFLQLFPHSHHRQNKATNLWKNFPQRDHRNEQRALGADYYSYMSDFCHPYLASEHATPPNIASVMRRRHRSSPICDYYMRGFCTHQQCDLMGTDFKSPFGENAKTIILFYGPPHAKENVRYFYRDNSFQVLTRPNS